MIEIDLGISSCGLIKAPESEGCPPKPTLVLGCIAPKMFGPNIQGYFKLFRCTAQGSAAHANGVFSIEQTGLTGPAPIDGTGDAEITFNASEDNSIYSGNNVQTPALQVLPCIRY